MELFKISKFLILKLLVQFGEYEGQMFRKINGITQTKLHITNTFCRETKSAFTRRSAIFTQRLLIMELLYYHLLCINVFTLVFGNSVSFVCLLQSSWYTLFRWSGDTVNMEVVTRLLSHTPTYSFKWIMITRFISHL